jgi:UDP-2,3-diacylglucosamine pyrophosphatase LpxH
MLERIRTKAQPNIMSFRQPVIAREEIHADAVVISDIHLGSPMCQAEQLDDFLSRIRVEYLILAGDIFDDLKFNRLQHWHWQVLSRIRKISDHCRVVWIRGNHDIVSARTMSHLLGVQVRNSFGWTMNGRTFFVIHGDRWDTFIYKHQTLTAFVTWLYNTFQRLNTNWARNVTRWVKKKAKLLTRNSVAVQNGALDFAKKKKINAIFCGHTHMAVLTKVDGIVYGNDGTWQSDDPHFIAVRGGKVDLCKFLEGQEVIIASELL